VSADPKPQLAPPVRRRKPRAGQWAGITRRPNAFLASVKCRGEQRARSFPLDTPLTEIQKWRSDTRDELSKSGPARGTLAGDIERHAEELSVNWRGWLRKWAGSTLGVKPRQRITREDCEVQLRAWKAEGYAGDSLNHFRQALISLWRAMDGPEHRCPARLIEKFPGAKARQGFFERDALEKVLAALAPHYRDVVEFAAFSGWRRQEVQQLTWAEVDLAGKVIRLSPERSKNEDGRVLPIVGPIDEVIERRAALRGDCPLPYVFWRTEGGKVPGHRETPVRYLPIGDWRFAWRTACKTAGCEGALFHDLRRTVVRDLTRAGVPEKVAMSWTGHKTRAVFDRYNIVSESDLKEAATRLTDHVRSK
jgi:integrase